MFNLIIKQYQECSSTFKRTSETAPTQEMTITTTTKVNS